MPLLFNGKPLERKDYESLVGGKTPKTKDKAVTFVLKNAQPLLRFTERGERTYEKGGIRPLSTSCIARIGGVDGELTYYESKTQVQGKTGTETNYEPKFVYFQAHELIVDAGKNESLFDYLLLNSENEENSEKFGKMASFKMVDTSEPIKKKIAGTNERLMAYDMVREAWEKNRPKIKAMYQNLGKTDYADLLENKDYDGIKSPIFDLCESNPRKVIDMLNSASLDVGATVTQAIERGLIKEDSTSFKWTKNDKVIWRIPQGRNADAFDLFVNFLKNEDRSGTLEQIKKDVVMAAVEVALT